ncbi:MAG: TetR/AcrR family transcriptional regulator [Actinobacteria bacterium]|nr:TetR/AcrR family transcriptional regulator [Actinomycetota bacterium]
MRNVPEHRQELRNGILTAAREIAASEGWRAVSMRRIAERIELKQPAIYEHFRSKDDLLFEISRQGYAEQLEAMRAARQAAKGPEEAIYGMWRAYVEFAKSSPHLYQVMYSVGEVSFSGKKAPEMGEKVVEAVGDVIGEVLRENGKEGEATENSQGKATLLWGNVHGLVSLVMIERLPGDQVVESLVEQTVRVHLASWRSG